MKKLLFFAFILLFFSSIGLNAENHSKKIPLTFEELTDSIQKILIANNTPAAGIAIVNPDTVWTVGIGYANIKDSIKANENTMFRIGSTSKMYIALAILKLQEEGKINLKNKVRDLVPEIEFQNQWEDSNPILIENLLEHTTGWDDIHFCDYAYQMPDSLGVKVGLDYNPNSRTSRWIPGTRMSYCNSGPSVAAYIVEKVTGQSFESYIQEHFFDPMGMENMTYFRTETYNHLGAVLYQNEEPQNYWQLLMRPTGSINASPKDMAKMIQFFMNRGKVDSIQLISEQSLSRMESALTTKSGIAGIEGAYGLNNYLSLHKGFTYRTHGGSVGDGLCNFSYLPEYSVGYTVLINSGDYKAFNQIIKLIRDFQTFNFQKKEEYLASTISEKDKKIEGYYVCINPRSEFIYFFNRMNFEHFWIKGDTLYNNPVLGGKHEKLIKPKGDIGFRSTKTGGLFLIQENDPLDGAVIHRGWHNGQSAGVNVLKKISSVYVFYSYFILFSWLLLLVVSTIWSIIWAIRFWLKKINGGANIWVRLLPLCTNLAIIIVIFTPYFADINNMGKVSIMSLTIMIGTIIFGILSFCSLFYIIKMRRIKINKFTYWFNLILSVLHVIITVYLIQFGIIGIQSWS